MANNLSKEKQVMVVSLLAEGNGIRSIERVTGVNRDTVMKLGIRVGNACQGLLDAKMRNLESKQIQVDELWSFIQKKEAQKQDVHAAEQGDVWTFLAIDPETKLIPSFTIGKRDRYHTRMFMEDLASRLVSRPQISSDGMDAYAEAVDNAFGSEVDYAQLVKSYSTFVPEGRRRYSPIPANKIVRKKIFGNPDKAHISTYAVERANLTMRHHCKRLTRLTLGFSKKLENFKAAMALNIAHYNLVKFHGSLRMTPAMAAGVESSPWTIEQLTNL